MKILAFLIAELGHVHPLLPTLRHLDADHDVVIAAAADVSRHVRAAGMRAQVVVLDHAGSARVTEGAAFAQALRDPHWLSSWVETLLLDEVAAEVPVMRAAIARHQPDVIVADPMLYAVAIAAEQSGVPWASLSSSLNPLTRSSLPTTALEHTLQRLAPRRAQIFADHGVAVPDFWVSDARSPWLNIAFSTAAFAADKDGVVSVGCPFDDDDVAGRDADLAFDPLVLQPGKPRLYVSFGSQAFHQPGLFRAVFAAASDYQVVASVGSLVDDGEFMAAVPRGAVVQRRVPQLRVLRHTDVMVSHGGANSVVEALAFGVPLVLLPLCNDQPLQGRFVAAAGAGVVVDVDKDGAVDEGELGAAIAAASTAGVRARVARIQRDLNSAGGPARAASLVARLGQTRAPVMA